MDPRAAQLAYFEHAFLARQTGIELVEASDLVVRDAVCYIRTTAGLQRVHAIYRRLDDDKAIYHYVPEMISLYLGEEPILDNVQTYLLTDEKARWHVLGRLAELVVKPTSESGGKGVFIGPQATRSELEQQARLI